MTVKRIGALALLLVTRVGEAPAQSCAGDCDDSAAVTIEELIRGVSMALGTTTAACDALDADQNGTIAINELIAAVVSALNGCGGTAPAMPANAARAAAAHLVGRQRRPAGHRVVVRTTVGGLRLQLRRSALRCVDRPVVALPAVAAACLRRGARLSPPDGPAVPDR